MAEDRDMNDVRAATGEWSSSPQEGTPGHCIVAQVWDENGNSLAEITPTDDPAVASATAARIAADHNAPLSPPDAAGPDLGRLQAVMGLNPSGRVNLDKSDVIALIDLARRGRDAGEVGRLREEDTNLRARLADSFARELELTTERDQLRERVRLLEAACQDALQAVDEAYTATGYLKICKTSEQRLRIEAALVPAPEVNRG
jgi:hypothetical protein